MNQMELKIAVICGGISSEREVSLKSGKAVFEALRRAGFQNAFLFDLNRETVSQLATVSMDLAFLALHGKGGEDGCIQGLLELRGIPYTGSSVEASAICMNKIRTKEILTYAGLPTPAFTKVFASDCTDRDRVADRLIREIKLPMVLKAPCQGSSIGVIIAKDRPGVLAAIDELLQYGSTILAEEFVSGVELTLPILGNEELTVFPAVEITSENEFYDYDAKYTKGMCHHIIPARIQETELQAMNELGKQAYRALGCAGLSRIDFILDAKRGPMIIEINTLPGMTEMSLFPDAARYAGVSFERLTERIVELALERTGQE